MRRGPFVLLLLLAACKGQTRAPAVTADAAITTFDAAPAPRDAPLAIDAAPPVVDAPPPVDAEIVDAGPDAPPEPDAAIATLYEHSVEGTVILLGADGGVWTPLPGVTVTVVCSREISPDDDSTEQRCDSVLTVEKDGKELARDDRRVAGLDWRAVAGNSGSLELSLFELESESGASYILVRSSEQEGDEQMHAETSEQLFAVRGDGLDLVLSLTTRVYDEPGPMGGGPRQELETELEAGKKKTAGMRNLIAIERNAKSGRTRGVVTYVWNGREYVDKKSIVHPIAMPDARP